MRSMPLHTSALRAPRMALVVAASLGLAPAALAETGGPLPQGYTSDVVVSPQPVAPAPAQPPAYVGVQAPAAPLPPPEQAADVDPDEFADTDPSALTDFREPLAPYGQWTEDPTYGTMWVPDAAQVGADFAPYQTAGQWAVTDGGDWAWQSDYAWGYIPFHYGRWVWAGNYWGWIPGRRYAPAWVTWRVGEGGYVGWAPLPPTWYWGRGTAVGLWTRPYAAYCFVPTNYFFYHGVSSYVVRDRGMVASIAAGTRPYHPATPTVGAHHPTFSEAHIPASAVPRGQVAADVRATSLATRSSTAAVRAGRAPSYTLGQGSQAPTYHGQSAWRSGSSYSYGSQSRAPVDVRGSGIRTPTHIGGQGQAYYGASPAYPTHAAPSYHSVPSAAGGFHPPAAQPSTSHSYSVPSVSHSSGARTGGHASGGHAGHR